MTGALSVEPGRSAVTGVDTGELDHLAQVLRLAADQCRDAAVWLSQLRLDDSAMQHPELGRAQGSIAQSSERLHALGQAVRTASSLYDGAERARATAIELLTSQVAAAAGFLASRLGLLLAPSLFVVASRVALVWGLIPSRLRDVAARNAGTAAQHLLPVLSEPAVLDALRVVLSNLDDAALGAVGLPPALVSMVGEGGLRITGIDTVALSVVGVAALAGANGVAPVRVERVRAARGDAERVRAARGDAERVRAESAGATSADDSALGLRRTPPTLLFDAPTSLAERVNRIPDPSIPITIERYTMPDGSEHVEVYLAGTDADAPIGGDRPFDMASNIALIAEQQGSSLQAVRAALVAEGVTPETSVVFTGYSQGGAIATVLAESGDYRTTGLVTVGAPTGALPVRGEYPAIVIEHRDDLVPALSGIRRETTAVIVRADALTKSMPREGALPAHHLSLYRRTAATADAAGHAGLRATIAALPHAAQRAEARTTGMRSAYLAIRLLGSS
jgi:dienelactone hydrolase